MIRISVVGYKVAFMHIKQLSRMNSMTRKPVDNTQKNKAFMICLLDPINNSTCNTTYEIENLLSLLKRAKTTEDFKEALKILTDASNHQLKLTQHFVDIVKSISIELEEDVKEVH